MRSDASRPRARLPDALISGQRAAERYHRTIKSECIRPQTRLSLEDARRVVTRFVAQYNDERLHSALGYVTPRDKLLGWEKEIFAERDRKLDQARRQRPWASGGSAEDRRRWPTPQRDAGPVL